jgi:hypothetical protein
MKWSYSSLSLFQQCPKKYNHLRVLKDVVEPQSEQILYGLEVHKAAEDYVREGKPLPEHLAYMKGMLDALIAKPGIKHAEQKLGLTEQLEPCGFMAKDVWWRGIADLTIVNGEEAKVIDYKTGNHRYADTKQLEILSLAIFKHYPSVKVVKSGLLFVVHKAFIKADFTQEKQEELWQYWKDETARLKAAYDNNVWNPKTNFTCKAWCPVTTCAHNGRN